MAIANQINNSLKEYAKLDENQLLIELGRQLESIENDFNSNDQLAAATVPSVMPDNSKLAGPIGDKFKKIAWTFLNRFNKTLYSIMCDPNDPNHGEIHQAAKTSVEKLGFVLAGILGAHFGWLPALVVVLAALLVKRFAKDTYEVACELWSKEI
jgi:hypothetical protein